MLKIIAPWSNTLEAEIKEYWQNVLRTGESLQGEIIYKVIFYIKNGGSALAILFFVGSNKWQWHLDK